MSDFYEKKIKEIRKRNESTTFENSKYGDVSSYIDTGDYGLNLILSGSPLKGCPSGRIVLLNGESQVGKSLIMAFIIRNAFKKHNYDFAWIFDSEGGVLKENLRRLGIDLSRTEHVLVDSVEDATIKILNTYNDIKAIKEKEPDRKFIMARDSIGALVPNKLFVDVLDKGVQKSDQGGRAKLINNFIKGATMPALRTDTTLLITNHVYEGPDSTPSAIKQTGGGKGLGYEATISVQMSRSLNKNEDNADSGESKYNATILKFLTTKNRLVKPFFTSSMFLSYTTGAIKYYGLVDYALKYGLITNPTQGYYSVPSMSDKKIRLKEVLSSQEIWDKIMPDLAIHCEKDFCLSTEDIENLKNEEGDVIDGCEGDMNQVIEDNK